MDLESGLQTVLRDAGSRPRFAKDGKTLVAEEDGQAWIYDLSREGTRTQIPTSGQSYACIWSMEPTRIITSSYEGGAAQLCSVSTANPGDSRRLIAEVRRRRYASSFSPDGTLAFVELSQESGTDIWTLTKDGVERPFLQTPYQEHHPRFSPDGHLLAYTSNETKRDQVYVQTYPEKGVPTNISIDGGSAPVWHPDGKKLYFLRGDQVYAVDVTPGATPLFGKPTFFLRIPDLEPADTISLPYDISPNGKRLVAARLRPAPERELRVILGLRPTIQMEAQSDYRSKELSFLLPELNRILRHYFLM
jgi:WD40 repeat protein